MKSLFLVAALTVCAVQAGRTHMRFGSGSGSGDYDYDFSGSGSGFDMRFGTYDYDYSGSGSEDPCMVCLGGAIDTLSFCCGEDDLGTCLEENIMSEDSTEMLETCADCFCTQVDNVLSNMDYPDYPGTRTDTHHQCMDILYSVFMGGDYTTNMRN